MKDYLLGGLAGGFMVMLFTSLSLASHNNKDRIERIEAARQLQEAAFKDGVQSGVNFTFNWYISHELRLGGLPVETIAEQCWTNRPAYRKTPK